MDQFVTLENSDPDFKNYLMGRDIKGFRALPVKTMNANTHFEKVTFQFLSSAEIKRPPMYEVLSQVMRFDLLSFTLVPVLTVLFVFRERLIQMDLALWAIGSLFFLHGAVFCRNDFIDHMKGVDRVNEKGGSRVIQKGWLLASTVQKIYWFMGIMASIFAVPIFVANPILLILAGLVTVGGIFGYSKMRLGRSHWIFSSMAVFGCLGPLLTMGMSLAISKHYEFTTLLMGAYFGSLALVYVELKHMVSIVVDDEADLSTLPVSVGFDKAIKIIFCLVILTAVLLLILVSTHSPGVKSLAALPLTVWLTFLAKKVVYVNSPLSSVLYALPKEVCRLHMVSGAFLILLTLI